MKRRIASTRSSERFYGAKEFSDIYAMWTKGKSSRQVEVLNIHTLALLKMVFYASR